MKYNFPPVTTVIINQVVNMILDKDVSLQINVREGFEMTCNPKANYLSFYLMPIIFIHTIHYIQ